MIYTEIYGHLSEVYVKEGDVVKPGQKLGKMGNTGKSFGAHTHFGIIPGPWGRIVRMDESLGIVSRLTKEELTELFRQYHYYLDYAFFGITKKEHERRKNPLDIVVTSGWGEPDYGANWTFHCGFDVVPSDRYSTQKHFDVCHNRSKPKKIVKTGFDKGYGNYILSHFDV